MSEYLTEDSRCDLMDDLFDEYGNLTEAGMDLLSQFEEQGYLI
jgi:hypothetical protein